MGFNRGEIRVKATNIGVMNRKGGKSEVTGHEWDHYCYRERPLSLGR